MCISDIADQILLEGGYTDITLPFIISWIKNNLGLLNNELLTSFVLEGELVVPELDIDAAAIFKAMFQKYYYGKQIQSHTGAGGYSSIQSVKEGNRTITKFNKTDIAKTLAQLRKELQEDIDRLILGYHLKRGNPEQIATPNPITYEDFRGDTGGDFNLYRNL